MGFRLRPATGTAGGRDEPLALGGGRDGVLYVPDTAEAGAPIMVFLHGATGSGRAHMRAVLGAVDRYGVILVAPDSRSGGTWDLIAERRFGPDVAFLDAVGDQVEVLVDGGFRRGADVVKAVALGARAVMIGRPWAYGLAAAGQPGVERVLSMFREDIDRTLRLLGAPSVQALDRDLVRLPAQG